MQNDRTACILGYAVLTIAEMRVVRAMQGTEIRMTIPCMRDNCMIARSCASSLAITSEHEISMTEPTIKTIPI